MYYPQDVNSEMPNCGVTAVAIISGKSVGEVYDYMKNKYSRAGHWKGRTAPYQVIETLGDFGIRLRKIFERKGSRRGPQLGKQAFALNTVYLVWTSGHVQVVFDEKVYDQYGIHYMEEYHGRRCFITHIMEVV